LKTLRALGIFLILASLVIACDPIRGQLRVDRAFSAKKETRNNFCTGDNYPCDQATSETITVQPGSYSMKVEQFGRNQVNIYLKAKHELTLPLSLPSHKEIPDTGSITLSSQESGQPFDLVAQTQTDVSETEPTRDVESCEIRRVERVCGIKPGGVDGKPNYQCWDQTYVTPGSKDVEYFYRTTTQNMQAQIVDRGSQIASFSGSRTDTDKIYLYEGPCIERRW